MVLASVAHHERTSGEAGGGRLRQINKTIVAAAVQVFHGKVNVPGKTALHTGAPIQEARLAQGVLIEKELGEHGRPQQGASGGIVIIQPGAGEWLADQAEVGRVVEHTESGGKRSEERRVGKECRSRWSA